MVADPPHLSHLGNKSVLGHFGTTDTDDILPFVEQLLDVARFILHPGRGTCVLKIADQVHDNVRQLQWYRTMKLAEDQEWNLCDIRIIDSAAIPTPQALRKYHHRSQVAWITLHPDMAICPGEGIGLPGRTRCACGCGAAMTTKQVRTANYLTPAHKMRAFRRHQKERRMKGVDL
jgi:hypothetical protein